MAIFHMSVKVGRRADGGAANHGRYIRRDARYGKFNEHHPIDSFHQNLPSWANSPDAFWVAADEYERKNGSAYREVEVALPEELSRGQNLELIKSWVAQEFPNQFCEIGLHWKSGNPHAHIQVCERLDDKTVARSESQYFKRANPKNPADGGCKKSTRFTCNHISKTGKSAKVYLKEMREARRGALRQIRENWAEAVNQNLARNGIDARIDSRSNSARGIVAPASVHVGKNAMGIVKRTGLLPDRVHETKEIEERRCHVTRRQTTKNPAEPKPGHNPAPVDRAGQATALRNPSIRNQAKPKAPTGFERIEDLAGRGDSFVDGVPNYFRRSAGAVRKVHQHGYKQPAYFLTSKTSPVAFGRSDGGISIPRPVELSDAQIESLLLEVSERGGAVEIVGADDFRARVARLADQFNISHNQQQRELQEDQQQQDEQQHNDNQKPEFKP